MGLRAWLFDENIIQGGISEKPVTSVTSVTGENGTLNLNEFEQDTFVERAAIMEYDGGLDREKAEIDARKRIIL